MRWASLIVLATVSTGCIGPSFKLAPLEKRTCQADFLSWSGGLPYHVDQGPGDGSFDYDPAGELVSKIAGTYDLKSGDFSWTTTYATDSFRAREDVTGFGTIWRDGDMDLEYELIVGRGDGSTSAYAIRSERYGCKETTRVEDADGELVVTVGTWTASSFDYVREWIFGPIVAEAEGSVAKDGSWTESEDYDEDGFELVYEEEGDGNGAVTREFTSDDGVFVLDGSYEIARSGEVTFDYSSKVEGNKKQLWEYTVDGEGNGEGTWEMDGEVCDLVFDEFDCDRKRCDGDSNGDCGDPPVPFPVL